LIATATAAHNVVVVVTGTEEVIIRVRTREKSGSIRMC
jgi:hypothetical protein